MAIKTYDAEVHVVVGILWREGRLLAARRPEGKVLGGYWEFPGGKVEAGESAEEALRRELREELAIEVQAAFFWKSMHHQYPHGPVLLDFFQVTSFTGEAKPLASEALRWVLPHEALLMDFLPPDLPLLQELAESSATDIRL